MQALSAVDMDEGSSLSSANGLVDDAEPKNSCTNKDMEGSDEQENISNGSQSIEEYNDDLPPICSQKFILIATFCFLAALGAILGLVFGLRNQTTTDDILIDPCFNRSCASDLCFCNTQNWEFNVYNGFSTDLYEKAKEILTNKPSFQDDIIAAVGDFPIDSSEEIKYLHELQTNRTQADEELIQTEIKLSGMVTNLLASLETPELKEIALRAGRSYAMAVPVFLLKAHFDRVRPSFLDTTLNPSIPVPPHPAYPSGHSTQASVMALVLGCVDPSNRDFYLSNAIGWRRELAGVHYPSDTEAGKRLASFVFLDVAAEIGLQNAIFCNATI